MCSRHAVVFAAAALALPGGWLRAQAVVADSVTAAGEEGVRVFGVVTDHRTERPLPEALVVFERQGGSGGITWQDHSDSLGAIRSPRLPAGPYRFRVEALGYRAATDTVTLRGYGAVELEIALTPEALELEPIVVVSRRRSRLELAGFYDRRRQGFGRSLDRSEIEASGASRVTDLFRGMAGLTISPARVGAGGIVSMRGGCVPDVILDGVRLSPPVRLDDMMTIHDVEGLEVYGLASTPAGYAGGCGTILAWSRDPRGMPGQPFSWLRVGVAAGLAAIMTFLVLG